MMGHPQPRALARERAPALLLIRRVRARCVICPKWTLNNTPLCALDLLIYIHFHLFKYCTYSALEYLAGLRLYPDLIINNVVPLNCIDSGLKVAFMNESIFN